MIKLTIYLRIAINQYFAARKQQVLRPTPSDKLGLPDAHFARALEGTLAREWLSRADEDAYCDL